MGRSFFLANDPFFVFWTKSMGFSTTLIPSAVLGAIPNPFYLLKKVIFTQF